MTKKRTIILKDCSKVYEEYNAVAAVTPGHLIELTSAGKVQKHSTSEGNVLPMFAIENELEGQGINDDYAADDKTFCWVPGRGDQVYAVLRDGESVVPGDFLASNGDGTLKKHELIVDSSDKENTIYSNTIVGVALETLDISTSSGAESSGDLNYDKRLIIRII